MIENQPLPGYNPLIRSIVLHCMRNLRLDDSLVGQVVEGGLHVTAYLGHGGMGATFKARQPELNRDVCVKFMSTDALSDLDSLERFKREARVLSQMNHANIVSCFAYGLCDNTFPFLIMEFLDGVSLRRILDDKHLEWQEACHIMVKVCNALEYAHNFGIIHRDIKPENIMVADTPNGLEPKLIDFGLAGKQPGKEVPGVKTLTAPGTWMGSVNYMAPEAFTGAVPHKSLDIYGAGCVLYEMLTNKQPFEADSPMAVMYKHINEALPPIENHAIPDSVRQTLDMIIRMATNIEPSARFESCGEFAAVLSNLTDHTAPDKTVQNALTTSFSQRKRLRVIAICAVVLITTITISYFTSSSRTRPQTVSNIRCQPQLVLSPEMSAARLEKLRSIHQELTDVIAKMRQQIRARSMRGQSIESINTAGAKNDNANAASNVLSQGTLCSAAVTVSDLENYLHGYGIYLEVTDEKTTKEIVSISGRLSELGGLSAIYSPELFELTATAQSDLCMCFGSYEAARLIIQERAPLRESFNICRNSPAELDSLIEELWSKRRTYANNWVANRLRPIVARTFHLHYAKSFFPSFVSEYGSDKTWKPDLLTIACDNQTGVSEDWLCALASLAKDAPDKQKRAPIMTRINAILELQPYFSRVRVDELARMLIKDGDTARGLDLLQRSLNRCDYEQYCIYSAAFINELAGANKMAQCRAVAEKFMEATQWKKLQHEWLTEASYKWTCPSAMADTLGNLEHTILLADTQQAPDLGTELLSHICSYLASREGSTSPLYFIQLYHCVRWGTLSNRLEQTYPTAILLAESYHNPKYAGGEDPFFRYASDFELGIRQWYRGERREGKERLLSALSQQQAVATSTKVGGAGNYMQATVKWFREIGLQKEARLASAIAAQRLKTHPELY